VHTFSTQNYTLVFENEEQTNGIILCFEEKEKK